MDADLLSALGLCSSEAEGWVSVGELGTALKQVRGRKLKGKLTEIVAQSSILDVRGKATSAQVRLRKGVAGYGGNFDHDDLESLPF